MKEAIQLIKFKYYITSKQITILRKKEFLAYAKDSESDSSIKKRRIDMSAIHDRLSVNKKVWEWRTANLSSRCVVNFPVFAEYYSFLDAFQGLFDCYSGGDKFA